ncbi:hypothetical protein [Paracoccus thiocyanatus]|uniref:DUF1127 domain-containing protein n=1 Tax=Paracoccus thiocyanatus TaxID=34006 RepID=A0A3D8PBT4_9RHOB|nr:hypothetical protein [Paracoccus thiocyanatus]RDW13530.1 hypothetical protein DIE28_07525 [Paracoccus thiocyanatus]
MATIANAQRPTGFQGFIQRLARDAEAHIEKHSRRAQIKALAAKSDAELARMNLSRDRIVHYVFSDRIWF